MNYKFQYKMFVESLRLVASPFNEQRKAIPDFAFLPDEILNTFGDAYVLLPQLVREMYIPESAVDSIKKIELWFSDMPTDGSIGSDESVNNDYFWQNARDLAAEALSVLGEEVKAPDLSFVFYTEGGQN